MSSINIATLTMHRRHEMELRVDSFVGKCDSVIRDIQKLKIHAQGFPAQLSNVPGSELKEKYLNCIKQLEEYTYLMTDFNISISTLGEHDTFETPVQDTNIPNYKILEPQKLNLIDVLSEPAPSTSVQCFNNPAKKSIHNKQKLEESLIVFSSSSNSNESILTGDVKKTDDGTRFQIVETMPKVVVKDEASSPSDREWPSMPAQALLEVDHTYPALILGVEGNTFWITTHELNLLNELMESMDNYYQNNKTNLSFEEVKNMTYCTLYDKPSSTYYRGLIITHPATPNSIVEVYKVDIGSVQCVPMDCIQPLPEELCQLPPFARWCHLAGVELVDTEEFQNRMEIFMNEYIAKCCSIEVEDNSSESLGVFVHLGTGETINELAVAQGITTKLQSPMQRRTKSVYGPPESVADDLAYDPEHEDALEAVTGYHNRDEAEICPYYKGGPEKTCFKGSRCKKKHILMHPDGWTVDKVEVLAKSRTLQLPEPGSYVKLLVTYVCHFDRLFAHIVDSEELDRNSVPTTVRNVPPKTLKELERDMNSPITTKSYKRFELCPAPGELVAALYPPDQLWYRARIHCYTGPENLVQLRFIDYGNVMEVSENNIRQLPSIFAELPTQAIRCILAGLKIKACNTTLLLEAKTALSDMITNKILEARIIARNYDDITVELFDEQGYSVAEILAARFQVKLSSYSVIDDKKTLTKVVVP